jgi:UDP-glucose 4-epimerase
MLVAGGAGYVGSHTCTTLLNAGHDVVVLDDFSNSDAGILQKVMDIAGRRLQWLQADIRDFNAVSAVVEGGAFDAIVHFAALKSVPESIGQPKRYWDVNVGGMGVLLRAAVAANVRKFIFSSSAVVYGKQKQLPIPETAPALATNPYALTKIAGEQLLHSLAGCCVDVRVCILRYFNPIGAHPSGLIGENPKQTPTNLFPVVLQASLCGGAVDIYGMDYPTPDGSAIRDFVHVMDVAEAHSAALDYLTCSKTTAPVTTLNLGTGEGLSVLQMIDAMERASGSSIVRRSAAKRADDIVCSVADVSKAAAELGWRSTRTLDDACRDGLRWLRASRGFQ